MSNEDSFIDEVSDELRRDRLYKVYKRYGWIAATAIVVIVGGASVNEWRKAQASAEAQATGDAILAALETQDPDARAEALAALSGDGNAARSALLALMAADLEDLREVRFRFRGGKEVPKISVGLRHAANG